MAETLKCPKCGTENEPGVRECSNIPCHAYLKTDLECLRSIDVFLRSIKNIAVWWLVLSIIGFAAGLIYFLLAATGEHLF